MKKSFKGFLLVFAALNFIISGCSSNSANDTNEKITVVKQEDVVANNTNEIISEDTTVDADEDTVIIDNNEEEEEIVEEVTEEIEVEQPSEEVVTMSEDAAYILGTYTNLADYIDEAIYMADITAKDDEVLADTLRSLATETMVNKIMSTIKESGYDTSFLPNGYAATNVQLKEFSPEKTVLEFIEQELITNSAGERKVQIILVEENGAMKLDNYIITS